MFAIFNTLDRALAPFIAYGVTAFAFFAAVILWRYQDRRRAKISAALAVILCITIYICGV